MHHFVFVHVRNCTEQLLGEFRGDFLSERAELLNEVGQGSAADELSENEDDVTLEAGPQIPETVLQYFLREQHYYGLWLCSSVILYSGNCCAKWVLLDNVDVL